MKYLETEEEKKSFAITSVIFVILFVLFFYLGLSYLDPPPENGITINFGTTEVGNGDIQPTEAIQSSPKPTTPKQAKASNEDVLSQDIEEAVVMKTSKKVKPTKEVAKEVVKEVTKVKPKEAPKPSKSTTDALSNLINGPKSNGTAKGGEGNDNAAGDKGSLNGNPYANSYYGSGGGSGNSSGWGLNGRKISSRGKEVQKCNEFGTVVVQITVNRNGNVIAAKYTKGTTNTNPCLIEPALATARKYKWQPDANAPETQIGFITVNFKLGE
ncbi:MAG TPA: energy transducer TonB [Flavobacterium sp.]|nr:energy transducer TonB [Flavobacterium sp.]